MSMTRPRRGGVMRMVLVLAVGVPLALVLILRFVAPPLTPLMVIRLAQGEGLAKSWRPLEQISPALRRAVIAAEDAKFCQHWGFDWQAIDNAVDRLDEGGPVLGASTISMQTAKNLFLWPGRDFLRKGLEAYLTVYLEALWPKRRILEMYLNIAEFGPGVYGAEAAAQRHFDKSAAELSAHEAALLAAVLPAPRSRSASRPSPGVARYGATIAARAEQVRLGADGACK